MKKYNTIYYLLFVLLIMGAFAAMAQNNYGLTILGAVAFAFSVLFAVRLIQLITDKEHTDLWDIVELLSLLLLGVILCLRVFYIRFVFVEWLFGIAGLLLIVVYGNKVLRSSQSLRKESKILTWLIVTYYLSLVLYIISMTTVPFIPVIAEPAGAGAFFLLLGFLVMGYLKKDLMVAGEKVSVFSWVGRFKDQSVVLVSLFFLFTLYLGFTKVGFLPRMYTDDFPQSYFQLVNQAETGKEKPVNGKYKHELFKEKYDRFVERNVSE